MSGLMHGKRGLIMGVANDHSIAWGFAKTLAAHGAELAFTYQGEALGKRVKPLAESLGAKLVLPCDVEDIASVDATFDAIKNAWSKMDFVVHAIGFSDKNELKGRYVDTTRAMFAFLQKHSPLGRGVTLDELGGTALYLLSDLSGGVTGETHFVDAGYNIISMPHPDARKDNSASGCGIEMM